MISNKLLREVLTIDYNFDMQPIKEWQTNTLEWYRTEVYKEHTYSINIYELAHKCKEWAIKKGYTIRTEAYDYMENDSFSGTYWWVIRLRPKVWSENGCPNCGANNSEPEAIFKACEWVLDNKDK